MGAEVGAGHEHGSTAGANRTRLSVALALTGVVVLAQAVGAVVTGSLALLVDTAHMLTDTVGLAMALTASVLVARPATDRHTWGLRRAEVISALAQAALLLAVGIFALVEGVRRLVTPADVPSTSLLVFGVIGLAANLVALAVLTGGRGANLNMRAAYLEVLNDALGSVAVIISALLIAAFGWVRADSVAGLLIAVLILPRTLLLLRESLRVLLEATPPGLDLADVRRHILEVEHVVDVHDLHVTRVASDLPVLTAHVTMQRVCFESGHSGQVLRELQACVAEHFEVSIEHSTFQIEPEGHAETEHTHHD
ncbi:Cobalt-zinc-cadmium resistance protein CzcD [Nocardioides dokdonensis FR1436]|uniref:Cobalt-zinc-cadmium resistance protein CzcD n=1 Tax=Nocardioides dokdonensis FR1436 TaxID=1300347 RepID=A0A1A9GH25_9ACTN|nr:cation diffusion facilitator family transporter [Nocardioides dokdonensis]ANH36785.1 Cobalt-zinc-cadmium resistance protein CzcD [Nocardioides dokdonensis FR1436]